MVRATSNKLAAWRPSTDTMVVVVPEDSGSVDVGSLPNGVTAEKFANNGIVGIVVHGPTGSWQVVQDGAHWLIRPGTGLKPESVLMLRDGWRVGGQSFMPQTVSAAGKDWQVAMVDSAHSVGGSIAGVVRIAGGAALPQVAAIIEKPVEKVIAKPEEIPASAPVEKIADVPPLKMTSSTPEVPAAKQVREIGKVSVEPAAPLRALGQPTMAASELPVAPARSGVAQGGMKVVNLNDMLARIEPAEGPAVVSETLRVLPVNHGLVMPKKFMASAMTSATQPTAGLAKVAIHPAPGMRPIGLGNVASEILPQMLGDVYMPGTVVSLTLPAPEKMQDGAHADVKEGSQAPVTLATVLGGVVSPTTPPSSSWNQTTLEPMAVALAEKEKPITVTPTVVISRTAPIAEDNTPVPKVVVNRILPVREGGYMDAVSDALQTIVEAPENSPRARDGEMNLAALYLTWQRPEEALGVLRGLPQRSDNLPLSPQARLYMGLAELARGEDPEVGLFDQGGQLGGHAKMWRAVAASRVGDYASALKLWPQERGLLPQYPAYLREMAQQAQATALVMVGDRTVAMKVVDELVKGYDDPSEVPVALKRLQGLARLGTPDEAKGLEYLAAAAEDMRDPAEAYKAKYQFVRALQQRHDLSDEQVRKYLTDLWFDWRGDDLERDVLSNLADLYNKENEPREALQYWQTLVRAYPHAPELNHVTEKMTDAFLRVFDPENPKIYDTLAYIGLYYDFSELVPNDARGDEVQEQVARLMTQANLWRRAVPILEQQLDHRPLDPAAQGRLALMLADAYGNLGNAADGIKLLDKWQHVATTTILTRAWKIEEAKLMMQLNRPDSANKALAGLAPDDVEARDLRIDATWAAKDWSGSIPMLQTKLAYVPAAQIVSDTGAQLATFRLGYAYGQLRDGENLDALTKRFAPGLAKVPQLADDMGAVAAGTGISASIIATGPLAPMTGALNDLNRMADKIQAMRDTLTAQRKQQHEYDDKMRYMDLLPPPAI